MAEPFNPDRLLRPGAIAKMTVFEDAREVAIKLLMSVDADEIGDLIEHAVDQSDRAQAVIFYLLCKMRGWPDEDGVAMVAGRG